MEDNSSRKTIGDDISSKRLGDPVFGAAAKKSEVWRFYFNDAILPRSFSIFWSIPHICEETNNRMVKVGASEKLFKLASKAGDLIVG